jgi:hypothetical protein
MGDYTVGQLVRMRVEIRDDQLGLADPTSVILTVQLPDLTTATPPVTKDAIGKYHGDYIPAVDGRFVYRFTTTGTPSIVEEDSFTVDPAFGQQQVESLIEQVADLVPSRTVPTTSTTGLPLNTFDLTTTPTYEQVVRLIESAVAWVATRIGTVHASLSSMYNHVVVLRAAGLVELSYPERDADVNTAKTLLAEADKALAVLVTADLELSAGGVEVGVALQPSWLFPAAPSHGDDPLY